MPGRSYPIWVNVHAPDYRSERGYGARESTTSEVNVGTSAQHSEELVQTQVEQLEFQGIKAFIHTTHHPGGCFAVVRLMNPLNREFSGSYAAPTVNPQGYARICIRAWQQEIAARCAAREREQGEREREREQREQWEREQWEREQWEREYRVQERQEQQERYREQAQEPLAAIRQAIARRQSIAQRAQDELRTAASVAAESRANERPAVPAAIPEDMFNGIDFSNER